MSGIITPKSGYKEQQGNGNQAEMTTTTTSTKTEVPRYSFVSRIRGARDIHFKTAIEFAQFAQSRRADPRTGRAADPTFTLQEHFNGGTMVHPYYDYDAKYKVPFGSDAAREAEEAARFADFKDIVTRLHPGEDVNIVYAKRHGVIGGAGKDVKGKGKGKNHKGQPDSKPDEYVYKISFRAWVQGVKIKAADIPRYVRGILGLTAKAVHPYLDLSVYKDREQLLGVIYGCKDIDVVKRYLVPLDLTEPLTKYLAQNVSEDDTLITLPCESQLDFSKQVAGSSCSGEKAKRGRPRKAPVVTAPESNVAVPDTVDHVVLAPSNELLFKESSKCFQAKYIMQESLTKLKINRDDTGRPCALIFPTTRKWCYIGHVLDDGKQEHAGNNPYISVTSSGARFKCPDELHKNADVGVIPFSDLPQSLRDLYNQKVYGDRVAQDVIQQAQDECRKSIQDNYPDETEIEPLQELEGIVTKAHKQRCFKCGSTVQFSHMVDGWCWRCINVACGKQFPDQKVPINAQQYPKLMGVLQTLQISLVVNGDINVTNNYLNSEVDFYADFTNDKIDMFEDPYENQLFIASLSGTDAGLSMFAVYHFRNRFHATSGRQWYRFVGHCWSDDAADLAFKEALGRLPFLKFYQRAALLFENGPVQSDEVKKKARMLRKLAVSLEDGKQRDRIVTDSIMKFHELRPTFEKELNTQNVMVFEDGVYDFETSSFGPGCPERAITISVPQPFVQYDEENDHVKFLLDFMHAILPDPSVCDYMLKVLALALTTDTSQQYLWILNGSGGNGKSKLVRLIEECLGPYYQALSPSFLTKKREDANNANEALMSLIKTRLVVFQEPESTDVLQASIIKVITGEDTLSTRANYGKQQKFRPTFKSFIATNTIPMISESTIAVWRRLRCIHFPMRFVTNPDPSDPLQKQMDPLLDQKLKAAAPYFISILIRCHERFRSEGLTEPLAVTKATDEYKSDCDIVAEFIKQCMEKCEPDEYVSWNDVYKAYSNWPQRKKILSKDLKEEFTKNGCKYQHTSTPSIKDFYGFKGWRLR